MKNSKILISGAGIAGPALAFWLRRFGFEPTVVERAAAPREGGHAVDVRGTARQVVERMGLVDQIRAAHSGVRRMAFVDNAGKRVATLDPKVFGHSGGPVAELAILRTDLARIIRDATRDDVEYVFGDSITAVEPDETGVHVLFTKGGRRRFDLLIGADGVHSNVRRLVFGPEDRYARDLGSVVSLFSTGTSLDLDGCQLMHTIPGTSARPGRSAGLYPRHTPGMALAGFFFRTTDRPRTPDEQKRLVAHTFQDAGWEVPHILPSIWDAPDFFFDRNTQIEMPTWSQHRVALVGDAAYCASPTSGIGTSLSLVGAHALATNLAHHSDNHTTAYRTYETSMRPFTTAAQTFARNTGDSGLTPTSKFQLHLRNTAIRLTPHLPQSLLTRGMTTLATTHTLTPEPQHTGR